MRSGKNAESLANIPILEISADLFFEKLWNAEIEHKTKISRDCMIHAIACKKSKISKHLKIFIFLNWNNCEFGANLKIVAKYGK